MEEKIADFVKGLKQDELRIRNLIIKLSGQLEIVESLRRQLQEMLEDAVEVGKSQQSRNKKGKSRKR